MKLVDRVLGRLVGKATAAAGPCVSQIVTTCKASGVCTGGHAKYQYTIYTNCTTSSLRYIGCC